MAIRWIDAGRVSSYRSQSIYHGLANAQTPETPDTVAMVLPEEPYISIGFFQQAAKEVDLNYCRSKNLPVIRRETGGGTVYINSGQVFVQWVCQPGILPRKVEQRFQFFNKAIIETYSFFGIQANHFPVNDVHVNGRKITGTGAATIGNAEVVTGNFLFDFDIDIMSMALNLPNSEFRTVIRDSLNNYMTWVKRELKNPPTYQEVIRVYRKKCEQLFGMKFTDGEFTATEVHAIEQAEEKLKREDWLHTAKSSSSKNKLVKIHAGVWVGWMVYEIGSLSIQVFSQMWNNTLNMIKFYLPAICNPVWSLRELEKALVSAPLVETEIRSRVANFFAQLNAGDSLISTDDWTRAVMQIKREVEKVSGHG